jgi:Dimerisation domain
MSQPTLNPSAILQTAFSFWSSKVLLTAAELGVFTKLANRKLTGAELTADFTKWCSEVAFQRFEVIHLDGPSSAAVAYK